MAPPAQRTPDSFQVDIENTSAGAEALLNGNSTASASASASASEARASHMHPQPQHMPAISEYSGSLRRSSSLSSERPRLSEHSGSSSNHAGNININNNQALPFRPNAKEEWLIDHHRNGLIKRIVQPVQSHVFSLFSRNIQVTMSKTPSTPSTTTQKQQQTTEPEFRISFAEMQRMHLRKLQIKLMEHAIHMHSKGRESAGWEADLASYIQAIKDHDYMLECSKRPRDVFLATGERSIDRYLMSILLLQLPPNDHQWPVPLTTAPPVEPREPDESTTTIPGTRVAVAKRTSVRGFWERFLVALVGGVFLVGPMWLMVLHNTLYTCLITTTLCVAAFGLLTASALDRPMEVLSSTAAYAAVLVVFVGLSTSPAV